MTIDAPACSARERILTAAADLLACGGSDAVSTRAIAAAAGVQAPTLYRLFGDKMGLLDAVTAYGFERYLAEKKTLVPSDDPVADLQRGWDNHVEFGLTHPAFYVLMYGVAQPERRPAAAQEAYRMLLGLLERVAAAGRLRMPPDAAARLIHATNTGVTLSLISTPVHERDADLSSRAREAILTATTTNDAPSGSDASLATRALALQAVLTQHPHPLTPAEAALLHDWLHRLATTPPLSARTRPLPA
ncbi:MAG TPA: TetR/AcrR family transcriptional regulator [Pseudonocardiaceae bacterium]|jgi:AcrR family transcriptional regulator|nr:TetR/AcrR family transcriptional regulator [Pseudonocardiaceae bacterium]